MHSLVHRQHSKHFLERQKEPLFPLPPPPFPHPPHPLHLSLPPNILPPTTPPSQHRTLRPEKRARHAGSGGCEI